MLAFGTTGVVAITTGVRSIDDHAVPGPLVIQDVVHGRAPVGAFARKIDEVLISSPPDSAITNTKAAAPAQRVAGRLYKCVRPRAASRTNAGTHMSMAWEDVDGDVIRLRAENAKTGEARMIPLEGELGELIARRRAARQVELDGTVMISSLIFHRAGKPIGDFRKAWARAGKKAGIQRIFHDLRRSACKNMLAAGVPQSIAMKISGHKTDSMFRRYAISSESDLRTALRRTQDYLKTVQAENVVAMPRPNERGQVAHSATGTVGRKSRK
jgi:Phage integrase family